MHNVTVGSQRADRDRRAHFRHRKTKVRLTKGSGKLDAMGMNTVICASSHLQVWLLMQLVCVLRQLLVSLYHLQ